ncbi:MAG: imidazoleglycerol-phosphate dehydratase HisB [Clostridia bacterium]|nr:imidazoleglycerol-phosphate dehydratase HisB [Clostridia bacterium]
MKSRNSQVTRKTKETDIDLTLVVDGDGVFTGQTGIGFFDHMLTLMCFYGGFDLSLKVCGDLETGSHHTVEDIGLSLGQAFREALGDKKGIERYSQCLLPMDEVLARCVLDISGRPTYVQRASFLRTEIGGLALEDVDEFFKSLCNTAGWTLHTEILYGNNDHHKVESLFKGVGRCIKESVAISSEKMMSTKGVL